VALLSLQRLAGPRSVGFIGVGLPSFLKSRRAGSFRREISSLQVMGVDKILCCRKCRTCDCQRFPPMSFVRSGSRSLPSSRVVPSPSASDGYNTVPPRGWLKHGSRPTLNLLMLCAGAAICLCSPLSETFVSRLECLLPSYVSLPSKALFTVTAYCTVFPQDRPNGALPPISKAA